MSLRGLVVAAVVLAAVALAWQKQDALQAWWRSGPGASLAAAQPVTKTAASPTAPGALRKCVKGQEVTYTNVECPAGYRVQGVAEAAVTVLPATPVAKPAESSSAPSKLHQALGLTPDERLKDRVMERAIEGAR